MKRDNSRNRRWWRSLFLISIINRDGSDLLEMFQNCRFIQRHLQIFLSNTDRSISFSPNLSASIQSTWRIEQRAAVDFQFLSTKRWKISSIFEISIDWWRSSSYYSSSSSLQRKKEGKETNRRDDREISSWTRSMKKSWSCWVRKLWVMEQIRDRAIRIKVGLLLVKDLVWPLEDRSVELEIYCSD